MLCTYTAPLTGGLHASTYPLISFITGFFNILGRERPIPAVSSPSSSPHGHLKVMDRGGLLDLKGLDYHWPHHLLFWVDSGDGVIVSGLEVFKSQGIIGKRKEYQFCRLFFFNLEVWAFCQHVYICTMCVLGAEEGRSTVWVPKKSNPGPL